MQVMFDHPKRTGWQLDRLAWPDGRAVLLVGHKLDRWSRLDHDTTRGARLEQARNCVVRAAVKAVGQVTYGASPYLEFVERDGGIATLTGLGLGPLRLGTAAVTEILKAVADERLGVEGGWITGLFTFAKSGTTVSLVPWDGPAAPTRYADPGDAPDLSAFIGTLGAPSR